MAKKLIDHQKAFEIYYHMGSSRSIPKLLAELSRRYKKGIPSEPTLNKWSQKDKWRDQIIMRDIAIRDGIQESSAAIVVDAKIKELEHLDRAMSEIDAVMPLIFDALQSATHIDPKTGKRKVTIIPESTGDMAALYNAQSRFVTAKVKLVETVRKI